VSLMHDYSVHRSGAFVSYLLPYLLLCYISYSSGQSSLLLSDSFKMFPGMYVQFTCPKRPVDFCQLTRSTTCTPEDIETWKVATYHYLTISCIRLETLQSCGCFLINTGLHGLLV